MGRIIGGVEIDRDPPGVPAAAALMPLDDTHRQLLPQGIELLAPHGPQSGCEASASPVIVPPEVAGEFDAFSRDRLGEPVEFSRCCNRRGPG